MLLRLRSRKALQRSGSVVNHRKSWGKFHRINCMKNFYLTEEIFQKFLAIYSELLVGQILAHLHSFAFYCSAAFFPVTRVVLHS